jgi:hypothetical protein
LKENTNKILSIKHETTEEAIIAAPYRGMYSSGIPNIGQVLSWIIKLNVKVPTYNFL